MKELNCSYVFTNQESKLIVLEHFEISILQKLYWVSIACNKVIDSIKKKTMLEKWYYQKQVNFHRLRQQNLIFNVIDRP